MLNSLFQQPRALGPNLQPGVGLLPTGGLCNGPEPELLVELPDVETGVVVATAVVLGEAGVELGGTCVDVAGTRVAETEGGEVAVLKQEQAEETRLGKPPQLK